MNRDQILKELHRHCVMLSEHFDAVQVVATLETEEGTICVSDGQGNWHARYGATKWWVKTQEGEAFQNGANNSVRDEE